MKNWLLKTFKKNKIVVCYMIDETGRITENVVEPKDGLITIDDNSYTYSVNDIIYQNGLPCLFFRVENPKPMNMKQGGKIPAITSQEFNTALNNTVVKELMKAGKDEKQEQLLLMGLVVCVCAVVGVGYFVFQLSEMVEGQQVMLQEILNRLSVNY